MLFSPHASCAIRNIDTKDVTLLTIQATLLHISTLSQNIISAIILIIIYNHISATYMAGIFDGL